MADDFLDIFLTSQSGLEQLPIEQLDEILQVVSPTRKWKKNISHYYEFIENIKKIELPQLKPKDREKIIKDLNKLQSLIEEYNTSQKQFKDLPLRPATVKHNIKLSIKQLKIKYSKKQNPLKIQDRNRILHDYNEFIQSVRMNEFPLLKSGDIKKVDDKLKQLQAIVEDYIQKNQRLRELPIKPPVLKGNIKSLIQRIKNKYLFIEKNSLTYYDFIKDVKMNQLPLLKPGDKKKVTNKLNQLKAIIDDYSKGEQKSIRDLPIQPSRLKSEILSTIKYLKRF